MSYVIYNARTTMMQNSEGKNDGYAYFKTEAAAKAQRTRMVKKLAKRIRQHGNDVFLIADSATFHSKIEKQVERTNAMTLKTFMEPVNANFYTSPSSEHYWCS